MTWRVALSLDVMLAEINRAAPNRSTASDGSIGDQSHANRTSDHNPNDAGVVRARDVTDDPLHGCNADRIAEHVRRLGLEGHPALGPGAYVIWDRRIASDTHGWVWRTYDGSNPHTEHVHVSVATDRRGYDSTAPWHLDESEDDTMNDAQDQRLKRIERIVDTTQDILIAKLTRANARIARANQRLERLRRQGVATRAEIETELDRLADDLADHTDDTDDPTPE